MKHITSMTAALLLGGVLLGGCGIAPTTNADGSVGFPQRTGAWMKEGTFVNVDNLRQVKPGLTKTQVYALIAEPHFSEGLVAVHVWNYIFNFRKPNGDVLSCQYQVQYDSGMKVKSTYFKDPECEAFVNAPAKVVQPAPVPAPQVQHFTLQAEALFPFGRSDQSDLSPKGKAELDRVAAALGSQYRSIHSISIAGHTDRIGSADYNQKLSLARAEAVRDYLVGRGVKAGSISVAGMGKLDPVTKDCPAGQGKDAIACLAPDRRVTIDVNGQLIQ